MSYVTNIILITGLYDGGEYGEAKNVKILSEKTGIEFERVEDNCGGSKCMEANVFLSAVSSFSKREFFDSINSITWESPESVQILIKDQNDDYFTVYRIEAEED